MTCFAALVYTHMAGLLAHAHTHTDFTVVGGQLAHLTKLQFFISIILANCASSFHSFISLVTVVRARNKYIARPVLRTDTTYGSCVPRTCVNLRLFFASLP